MRITEKLHNKIHLNNELFILFLKYSILIRLYFSFVVKNIVYATRGCSLLLLVLRIYNKHYATTL